MKTRLPVATFDLPVDKICQGYYSAAYFNRTKHIAEKYGLGENVLMQVFQRNRNATVCGVDEAIAILKVGTGGFRQNPGLPILESWTNTFDQLEVRALHDGDKADAWEPVLTIRGNYADFAHLESLYLGALARGTRVATNTAACVKAAGDKPILFFADRFDYFGTQERDGYAATIGGAKVVATDAMGAWIGQVGGGTMPHALIAVCNRSVAQAGVYFAQEFPDVDLIGLVDFNNDCVGDALEMLRVHGKNLKGVRLDTSGNMVDESLQMHRTGYEPGSNHYGVTPRLVKNVRDALDQGGGEHVKIYVSGGFTPERIESTEYYFSAFNGDKFPGVDGYGIGSSLLQGSFDYTADIVAPEAKNGRWKRDDSRLSIVT